MSCGRTSPLYSADHDPPQVNMGGGLGHAFTVHAGEGGDARKGMFFQGTSDETITGYAQQVIRGAYDSGTLHESHINQTDGHIARDMDMGGPVGYSRDSGESTNVVRCAFDLTHSTATIASVYPV